jgi:tetratricopeptide (TPR) repeat protein
MRSSIFHRAGVLAVCVLVSSFALNSATFAFSLTPQDQKKEQDKDQKPNVSPDEQRSLSKINSATGAEAKIKAANDYLKKYSKSPMRVEVAKHVADEIVQVKDNEQKISLSRSFLSTFNQPEESDLIKPIMIEAFLTTGKIDDALNESTKHLERNPGDVVVLTQLAWAGAMQAQKGGAAPKLLQTATDAGTKAIQLMEADKKPERMTAENWNSFRNSWLPRLYQSQGVIRFYGKDIPGAKENLEKAVGLDPYDPPTLLMLVTISNEQYNELAKKYQTEKKSDQLKQALATMDEAIDWMARAIAATEGQSQFQSINEQLKENLKQYYGFRHEGKTDGMNELIQKYKKPN